MNKVGRPVIYNDHNSRIETRRKQNRENQRRCRMRRRTSKEPIQVSKSKKTIDKEYQTPIVDFFKQFPFDYYFTGTVDPNKKERKQLKKYNDEIKKLNQEFQMELGLKTERRIGIKSLRKYTERYLQYLYGRDLFEYCFVVFETGKNNKYHTHILFKSNPNKICFDLISKDRWLLGDQSKTIYFDTVEDKENILKYCMKEVKRSSSKITDLNKVDNWFINGNFLKTRERVKETVSC